MSTAVWLLLTIGPAFPTFYIALRRWQHSDAWAEVVFLGALIAACVWPLTLTALAATRPPREAARIRRARAQLEEARLLAERDRLLGLTTEPEPTETSI